MDKEKFQIQVMEFLSRDMDKEEKEKFEQFLKANPDFKHRFEEVHTVWDDFKAIDVPEPSEQMDAKFYSMLHDHMEIQEKTAKSRQWDFKTLLQSLWRPQVAYGLLLLVMGLAIGFYWNVDRSPNTTRTTVVSNPEAEEVREDLVLTLLEQPSANKRLKGVSEANKIGKVDETVIKALLQTLNNDSNVNVRLAAIESLTHYVDNPVVREGLVQSIILQDSPIVQMTLADLMVALQEKKSIEPFKKLMRSKELNDAVKQKLENSIQQII